MTELDFRYTLDGKEVEAFQVTEETLFQEKRWPAWMNSKMLMSKGDANSTKATHWLTVDDVEMEIPKYGWIVRNANGDIRPEGYEVMETAIKLVEDPGPKRDAPTEVDEESLIQLQAALQKRDPDEIRAERAEKLAKQPKAQDVEIVVAQAKAEAAPAMDDPGHFETLKVTLTLLQDGQTDATKDMLCQYISNHTNWCNCPPGNCDGERDKWECRQSSPLVGS